MSMIGEVEDVILIQDRLPMSIQKDEKKGNIFKTQ